MIPTVPIVRVPVRQQVEEAIKAMIVEGTLSSGHRLIERECCEVLGVSRSILREAFRRLEAERLLARVPGKGLVVSEIGIEEAREIYRVRALLESEAARTFAATAKAADIAALARCMVEIDEALRTRDAAGLRRAKNGFYATLVGRCGNATLAELLRLVHGRIQLLRTTTLAEPGRMAVAAAELREILAAIQAGRPDAARAASLLHIQNAEAALARAVTRGPGEGEEIVTRPRAKPVARKQKRGAA